MTSCRPARRAGGAGLATTGAGGLTPRYAAPEQWNASYGGVGPTTDLFAVGGQFENLNARGIYIGVDASALVRRAYVARNASGGVALLSPTAVSTTLVSALGLGITGAVIGGVHLARPWLPDVLVPLEDWRLSFLLVALPAPAIAALLLTLPRVKALPERVAVTGQPVSVTLQ